MEEIQQIIKNRVIIQIRSDLITGRSDAGKDPYTGDQIDEFIEQNTNQIQDLIHAMISDYQMDGNLEALRDPENDWIRDYLYDYVNLNND